MNICIRNDEYFHEINVPGLGSWGALQNPSFFDTKFLVFNAHFLVLNTKFIIFAHRACRGTCARPCHRSSRRQTRRRTARDRWIAPSSAQSLATVSQSCARSRRRTCWICCQWRPSPRSDRQIYAASASSPLPPPPRAAESAGLSDATLIQNSSFLMQIYQFFIAKLIIFNTNNHHFNTKFMVLNTQSRFFKIGNGFEYTNRTCR